MDNNEIKEEIVKKAHIYYINIDSKDSLSEKIDMSDKVIYDENTDGSTYRAILIKKPEPTGSVEIVYGDAEFYDGAEEEIVKKTKYKRAPWGSLVKNNKIVASAVSGNDYHEKHGCIRKKLGIVSGQYEICPGCHPDVHAEAKTIANAREKGLLTELSDATYYLTHHWWVCNKCAVKLENVGVKKAIIQKSWVREFLNIRGF